MKVAIIGAGLIGRAWGICFARGGHEVVFYNRTLDGAHAAIAYTKTVLPELEARDLLNGATAAEILGRMRVVETIEDAVKDADFVQENVAENVDVKIAVYKEMERYARPDCIFGSSTSGIVPSKFTAELKHRDRCVVTHPLNPPYIIPAVDLVPSPWTSDDVMERTSDFLKSCGQAPIRMKKEDPGFLTIRLQGAIYHEAFRLVAEGLAAPEDVDICIRDGLALRWSFIGPFETADLNAPGGIRDFVGRFGDLYSELYPKDGPTPWVGSLMDDVEQARRDKLPLADQPARQMWRDRRLIALAEHKRAQNRIDNGPHDED